MKEIIITQGTLDLMSEASLLSIEPNGATYIGGSRYSIQVSNETYRRVQAQQKPGEKMDDTLSRGLRSLLQSQSKPPIQ